MRPRAALSGRAHQSLAREGFMLDAHRSGGKGIRFATRVFTAAAVYGILVLAPQYFLEDRVGRDFPPSITHPEHFYGFIGVALAWQVLFLIIASDPVRYRPAMLAAIL